MIATQAPGLSVVVLAAGLSRRFGRDKATVRIRGQTMLERMLAIIRRATDAPIIVVRAPRQRRMTNRDSEHPIRWCNNPDHAQGLSTSLRCGLRAAKQSRAALILAADLPFLDDREISRMLRIWRSAPTKIVARRIGDRAGMPLIIPKRYFGWSHQLRGEQGFASLLHALGPDRIRLVDQPSAAVDIDTPADYRRALSAIALRNL